MALYSKAGTNDKHVKAFIAAGASAPMVDATFGPGTYARVTGATTLPLIKNTSTPTSKPGANDKHVKAFIAAGASAPVVDATFGPGTYERVKSPNKAEVTPQAVNQTVSRGELERVSVAILKPYTDDQGNVDISRAMAQGVSAQVIDKAFDTGTAISYGVMSKFYDKDTELYDIESAEKAGVSSKIIKQVIGDDVYKEYKIEQARVKAENEKLAKEQAEFKRKHSQNPLTGNWHDNHDVAQYSDAKTQKTDWNRFTLDQARVRLQKLIEAVGYESAYSQIMATGTKHERQAAIEEARFRANHIQDPKTKEWVTKDWAKPFIEVGIFNTYKEAQSIFDDGGIKAVNNATTDKVKAQQSAYHMAVAKDTSFRYEAEKDFFQGDGGNVAYRGDIIESALRREFEGDKYTTLLTRKTYDELSDTKAGKVILQKAVSKSDYSEQSLKELLKLNQQIHSGSSKDRIQFTRDVWDKLSTETQNILLNQRAKQIHARKSKTILDFVPVIGTVRTVKRHGFKSGWSWLSAGLDATIVLSAMGVSARTAVGAAKAPLKPVKGYAKLTGFEELATQSAQATKYISTNALKSAQRIEEITKANVARHNVVNATKTYGRLITEDTALNVNTGRAGLQEAKKLYGGAMTNLRAMQMEYIDALKAYDTTAMRRNQIADLIRARQPLGETPLTAAEYANLNALKEADEILRALRNRIRYTGSQLNKAGNTYGELVLEGTGLTKESLKDITALSKQTAKTTLKGGQNYVGATIEGTALSPTEIKAIYKQLDNLGLRGQKKLSDLTQNAYERTRNQVLAMHQDQKGIIYSEVERLERLAASKASGQNMDDVIKSSKSNTVTTKPERKTSQVKTKTKAPSEPPITQEQYEQLLKEGLTEDDILRAAEKAGGDERIFWEEINKIRRLYMAVRYALDKPLTTAEEKAVRKMIEEAEKYGKEEMAKKIASIKPTPKSKGAPKTTPANNTDVTWAVGINLKPGTVPSEVTHEAPFYEPYPDIFPDLKPDTELNPAHKPKTAPRHATKPEIQLKPGTQPETEAKPETKPQEKTKTKTETKTKTRGKTAPAPAPAPAPKEGPKLEPVPGLKQVLEIKSVPEPEVAPKAKEDGKTKTKTATATATGKLEDAEIVALEGVPDKPGETLWKQGFTWIEAKPPSPGSIKKGAKGQVKTLPKAPADAPVKTGSPSKTIYTRGKAPELMKVRIGNQVATVKRGRSISFDRSPVYLTRSGRKIITHRAGKLLYKKR